MAERSHSACIDNAIHSALGGSDHHIASALEIASMQFLWAWRPEAVIGSAMIDSAATADRAFDGSSIGEISERELYWQPLQVVMAACWPNQTTHRLTAREKSSNQMCPYKARSASD